MADLSRGQRRSQIERTKHMVTKILEAEEPSLPTVNGTEHSEEQKRINVEGMRKMRESWANRPKTFDGMW